MPRLTDEALIEVLETNNVYIVADEKLRHKVRVSCVTFQVCETEE
jgi:rRNA-processing protein FCF1